MNARSVARLVLVSMVAASLLAAPTSAAAAPDLVVTSTVAATTVNDGASLAVTARVANAGPTRAAASTTRFFLSRDRSFSSGDSRLATKATVALGPKLATALRVALPIERTRATGTWFVLACADGGRLVRETIETNNCRASAAVTVRDRIAPTFAGPVVLSMPTESTLIATWPSATDNVTRTSQFRYDVCVSTNATACSTSFTATMSVTGAPSVTLTGLQAATSYTVVVRVRDLSGNSRTAPAGTGATVDLAAPSFGGATTASTASSTSITVSWGSAVDAVTPTSALVYDVCVATAAATCTGSFTIVQSVTGLTQATITGLTDGTTYYVVVRARDAAGNRDGNVAFASATTLDGTAPTFGGATTVNTPTVTTLAVHWATASDNVTAAGDITYRICRSTTLNGCAGGSFAAHATQSGGTSVTLTGLSPGTTYYVVVRARDAALNETTGHVAVSGTTSADLTPPTAPSNVQQNGSTSSTIVVAWSPGSDNAWPEGTLVYKICLGTFGGDCNPWRSDFTAVPGANSYTIGSLPASATYWVSIKTFDNSGNFSPTSSTVMMTTTG